VFSPSDDIEYAAIKTIHKQLDDNADGSVDFSESAEVSGVIEWVVQPIKWVKLFNCWWVCQKQRKLLP
jgi:hypothetical protein